MSGDALDIAMRLRALTPARVGLGRTGVSHETRDLLAFQRAHALARDAVHAKLDAEALAVEIESGIRREVVRLRSRAANRAEYLQRPDLGRRLDEASRVLLVEHGTRDTDLALVVADGLSALAVERHSVAVLKELLPRVESCRFVPICVVEQGRVAIGDEIGQLLGAQLSLVLIGERPGLSSPDSLGAYITWRPQLGRTDAERNCVSNIRGEGLSYAEAAVEIACYLTEARRRQLTGVALKDANRELREG